MCNFRVNERLISRLRFDSSERRMSDHTAFIRLHIHTAVQHEQRRLLKQRMGIAQPASNYIPPIGNGDSLPPE